jgi:hypothetical protein
VATAVMIKGAVMAYAAAPGLLFFKKQRRMMK